MGCPDYVALSEKGCFGQGNYSLMQGQDAEIGTSGALYRMLGT